MEFFLFYLFMVFVCFVCIHLYYHYYEPRVLEDTEDMDFVVCATLASLFFWYIILALMVAIAPFYFTFKAIKNITNRRK